MWCTFFRQNHKKSQFLSHTVVAFGCSLSYENTSLADEIRWPKQCSPKTYVHAMTMTKIKDQTHSDSSSRGSPCPPVQPNSPQSPCLFPTVLSSRLCISNLCCEKTVPISLNTMFKIMPSLMGLLKTPNLISLKSRQAMMLAIVRFGCKNMPFHSKFMDGLDMVHTRKPIIMLKYYIDLLMEQQKRSGRDSQVIHLTTPQQDFRKPTQSVSCDE